MINKKKDGFLNIIYFIYTKLKPIETFKENMKKEFLKINRKFHQITKMQKEVYIKNPYNTNKSSKNLQIIGISKLFMFFGNVINKSKWSSFSKIIIFANLNEINHQFDAKNSLLKYSNRSIGVIKHLYRSEETTSLHSKSYSQGLKETPSKNKENSCSYQQTEYNEELISAINFINNL